MISAITSGYLNPGIAVGKVNDLGNGKSTIEYLDGTVISCQPGGILQSRPNGTAGEYEQCVISGNLAVYNPAGIPYFFGVA